jgi:hypothetical protein
MAAVALLMEHISLALNPRVALYGNPFSNPENRLGHLIEIGGHTEIVVAFKALLEEQPLALYRVRRLFYQGTDKKSGKKSIDKKGGSHRSTEALATGTHDELVKALQRWGEPVELFGTFRVDTHTRDLTYPTFEESYIICPHLPDEKVGYAGFETSWLRIAAPIKLKNLLKI